MRITPSILPPIVAALSLQAGVDRTNMPVPNPSNIDYSTFKWVNDLPEGREAHPALTHKTFWSEKNQADVGYYLYLPESYSKDDRQRFPVIYQLHGGRPGAEYKGLGGFPAIYKAMEKGDFPPVIWVGVNGGRLSHYDHQGYYGETAFLELVEHLDETLKTIPSREGRILQGGSQGGRGVTRYIMKHADKFGSALAMASGYQWENHISLNGGVESELLTIDDGENNVWDLAEAYVKDKDDYPVDLLIVIGDEDANYVGNLRYHEFLNKLGIENELLIATGQGHGIKFSLPGVGPKMIQFQKERVKKAVGTSKYR